MSHMASKIMWLQSLIQKHGVPLETPKERHFYNQPTTLLANTSNFNVHLKYVEVDCHFILDMVLQDLISPSYILDIFTTDLIIRFNSL